MNKTTNIHLFFFIIFIIIVTPSCGGTGSEINSATETAQFDRSISLATQMANSVQATNEVRFVHVTETANAFEVLLDSTLLWPIVLADAFDEDNGTWPVGEDIDTLAKINWEIKDGRYEWNAEANSGFVWWSIPESMIVQDFYLSVEVDQIDVPQDGEVGLVFRSDSEDYYYNFSIEEQGRYSVFMHSPDGWEAIIDWTPSRYIQQGESNKLSVIGIEDTMLFFINDRFLNHIVDDRLEEGEAGLIIGLSQAGDSGYWAFDNFELRTPDRDTIEAHLIDQ